MARETKCLTSGAIFHIGIHPNSVVVDVDLPFELDIDEEEAEILSALIHNQLELVLRPYWGNKQLNQKPICEVSSNGAKHWYLNDKRHRVDGPACEYANGNKEWYLNGKLHRVDGPAVEYADGTKYWYLNDKLHRVDGPAVEHANRNNSWYLNNKHCKPIEVFKAATHEQQIHMLCFYASEFMP